MADFLQQIEAFRLKTLANFDAVVADVTTSLATSLVEKSPVDTGELRANWQFSAAAVPSGVLSAFDQAGSATIGSLSEQIKQTKAGGITYIVNNVPYVMKVEFGGYPNPPKSKSGKTINGYSTQAPAGMRDITVLEFQAYVQRAVAKL